MTDIRLNNYLVAFIDVLGQRSALAKLTRMPITQEEKDEATSIIEQTYSKVKATRVFFESFFAASKKDHPSLDTLDEDTANEIRENTKSNVGYTHFSDSTVVSVSLASDEGDLCETTSGVLDALAAACYAQISTLGGGIPIRGGIEIGPGSPIGDQEVYGPVLNSAYHLESRRAGYPRIVVGPELVRFIHGLAEFEPSTTRDEFAVQYGQLSRGLLTTDEDGLWITDFAGRQTRQVFEGSRACELGNAAEIFRKACEFVESEYLRFRDAGIHVLAARYLWLRRYLDRRSECWVD